MDVLAGYGSDSDSDASSKAEAITPTKSARAEQGPSSSLVGLLGVGSDSSSDEGESEVAHQPPKDDSGKEALQKTSPIYHGSTKESPSQPSSKKRPRLYATELDGDLLKVNGMPSPSFSSRVYHKMPYFQDIDYLSMPPADESKEHDDDTGRRFSKFEQLAKSLESHQSWVSHLREQKEFNNPHFFQSVVEYFGISQPLGSHLNDNEKSIAISDDAAQ
jgi:hypothetical protein